MSELLRPGRFTGHQLVVSVRLRPGAMYDLSGSDQIGERVQSGAPAVARSRPSRNEI
jgi:hypothetical protein